MADKATFKVSSAVAPYLGADKPREDRLKAAAGQVKLPPTDFALLLYYLCHDLDQEIKRTAMASLRALEVPFLSQLLSDRELHPRILDALVQLHFKKPELAPLFAAHPMLSEKAADFLVGHGIFPQAPADSPPGTATASVDIAAEAAPKSAEGLKEYSGRDHGESAEESAVGPSEAAGPVDEDGAEFQSKFQIAQNMGVGEKIKAALTGDKEWRNILIKDANKLVSVSVVRNPRITDGEVLAIAKSAVQNEEIMRVICANKEWVKSPLIRKALAENNKTPVPSALRFVATLSEKDLSSLAKNKNVSSVVASQARRMLMTKREGR